MKETINIAIDGPSGAGKSTIARIAAETLGYIYVDTGALYRAVALHALRAGADTKDADAVIKTLPSLSVSLRFQDGVQCVYLGEEDVSADIRTPEVSMAASDVAAIPQVREALFLLQQKLAAENNCVMDGRDIGTVVLPDAQIKLFLTASAEDRAQRRYEELIGKGVDCRYEDVLEDVKQRDYNDMNREIAPLKPAQTSILVDTTGFELEQSVSKIVSVIKEQLAQTL